MCTVTLLVVVFYRLFAIVHCLVAYQITYYFKLQWSIVVLSQFLNKVLKIKICLSDFVIENSWDIVHCGCGSFAHLHLIICFSMLFYVCLEATWLLTTSTSIKIISFELCIAKTHCSKCVHN